MGWKSWLTLLACVAATQADEIALVRLGDVWRWSAGRDAALASSDAWIRAEFNDRDWTSGPSGFALTRSGREASLLGFPAAGHSTVRFRREFVVSDPLAVKFLVLRIDWDGGFIAFLNGVEVARRNLPGDPGRPVPFDAPGLYRLRGTAQEIDLSAEAGLLRSGTNLLAIQWHCSLPVSFAAGIVPELLANFTRGPFLQAASPHRQTIVWKTLLPGDSAVEFGPTPEMGLRVADTNAVVTHAIGLTNLTPDTRYFYRAETGDADRRARSPLREFRTFKEQGNIAFAVMADVGSGYASEQAVSRFLGAAQPDLVLVTGDLVYPIYTAGLADLKFFSAFPQMSTTPFFAIAGNHDVVYAVASTFLADFFPPTNSVPPLDHLAAGTSAKHYYSFDHGDAHFAGLYVPLQFAGHALVSNSPQLRWLEADLAASTKPWKFLFFHVSIMSSGPHHSDDYNYNGIRDNDELASLLLPLARQHGVQVIFTAHDHGYERFRPVGGVHCVVSAGGGGELYWLAYPEPASAQYRNVDHFLKATLNGDELEIQAIDATGTVFDVFHVRRQPPAAMEYAATWHTPHMEETAANDGDGNVMGQRFDFEGESIPAAPGLDANLGRLRVNYDHTYLYLGFEETMLAAGHDLVLFLSSPALPGVTDLVGLGNGLPDPAGQGVDGLDFLENLAFTNFTPSIACVLGDEFADGQHRAFMRSNLFSAGWPPAMIAAPPVAAGQGVFHLDAAFSDVPGARVQQFNLSPQDRPVAYEQNADFIEVAVPLAALGRPFGQRLHLGAVVANGFVLGDPDGQARPLDGAFLGARLVDAGAGRAVLEGLDVMLGPDLDADGDGLLAPDELALGLDPARADTDGDGLPDGWEVQHGLRADSADGNDGAAGDADGDGLSNLEEWRLGTVPNDGASALRLSVTRLPDGRLRFTWGAVPGRGYLLEVATDLHAAFRPTDPAQFPRIATSTRESVDLATDPATGFRLFRLKLLP